VNIEHFFTPPTVEQIVKAFFALIVIFGIALLLAAAASKWYSIFNRKKRHNVFTK